jgi:hypothetical protein
LGPCSCRTVAVIATTDSSSFDGCRSSARGSPADAENCWNGPGGNVNPVWLANVMVPRGHISLWSFSSRHARDIRYVIAAFHKKTSAEDREQRFLPGPIVCLNASLSTNSLFMLNIAFVSITPRPPIQWAKQSLYLLYRLNEVSSRYSNAARSLVPTIFDYRSRWHSDYGGL